MAKRTPAEPVKERIVETGQYTGTGYPNWRHNGQSCTIVERRGPTGVFVKFEGDEGLYLVHVNDIALK